MSWAPEISPKQKVMGKLEGKVATSLPMDIAFDLPCQGSFRSLGGLLFRCA
jgi:hypothetical protein